MFVNTLMTRVKVSFCFQNQLKSAIFSLFFMLINYFIFKIHHLPPKFQKNLWLFLIKKTSTLLMKLTQKDKNSI